MRGGRGKREREEGEGKERGEGEGKEKREGEGKEEGRRRDGQI